MNNYFLTRIWTTACIHIQKYWSNEQREDNPSKDRTKIYTHRKTENKIHSRAACLPARIYTNIYTHTHTHIYANIHTRAARLLARIYIYIYIYTYIHTYIHTYQDCTSSCKGCTRRRRTTWTRYMTLLGTSHAHMMRCTAHQSIVINKWMYACMYVWMCMCK
jgi:hypothetical protein